MSELRFYLDENVPTEVGRQLLLSGIDAVSVGWVRALRALHARYEADQIMNQVFFLPI